MAFLSAKASKTASGGGGTGGYLSVSKLGDGEFYKVAIVSQSPLEFWEVWGEDDAGTKKPFRFVEEPSSEDIKAELGDFRQRMNYDQTALEAPKFVIAFFVYDYADEKIKVFSIPQKTVIREIDKLSHDEDYGNLHAWDLKFKRDGLKMNTVYSILPVPRAENMVAKIDDCWRHAQHDGYDINQLLKGGNPFGA